MFDTFFSHLSELATSAGFFAMLNIVIIDVVMSGDNAILIGMATNKLHGKDRKKAIFFGIALATILRIILAFFTVYLLKIVGLQIAGGILLMYVVWKFYWELRSDTHATHQTESKEGNTKLLSAIWTIIIADLSMSLDNVLAVAGAAKENIAALAIGLVFSIILMAFASNMIASSLDKYPQIQWAGLFVILLVAIEMMYNGSREPTLEHLFAMNIFPFIFFVVALLFGYLQQKYLPPIDQTHIQTFLKKHFRWIIAVCLMLNVVGIIYGSAISNFFQSHKPYFYAFIFIVFLLILELFLVFRKKKHD